MRSSRAWDEENYNDKGTKHMRVGSENSKRGREQIFGG